MKAKVLFVAGLLSLHSASAVVLSVLTHGNLQGVEVLFSEPLDPVEAVKPENYLLSNATSRISISAVTLLNDREVRLTAPLPEGQTYSLTIPTLQALAGPVLDPLAAQPISQNPNTHLFLQVHGKVEWEHYSGLVGYDFLGPVFVQQPEKITNNFQFLSYSPDWVVFTPQVFIPQTIPDTDYIGGRLKGYLVPEHSDFYVFYLNSDNQSALFLSTDGSSENSRQIAHELLWSGLTPFWNYSAPVELKAGNKYYFEAVFQDDTGGDYLKVFWQRIGERPITLPEAMLMLRQPIGSCNLSLHGYSLGDVKFKSQPGDQTTTINGSAYFNAMVDGAPPYEYQWYKNGEAIAGANGPEYSFSNAAVEDHQSIFTLEVKNRFSSVVSREAVLTVSGAVPIRLSIQPASGNKVILSWPEEALGWTLQTTDDLGNPFGWVDLFNSESVIEMEVPLDRPFQFFQLRQN